MEKQGHSLKLGDVTIEDARTYVALLQGKVTKYDGKKRNCHRSRYPCSLKEIQQVNAAINPGTMAGARVMAIVLVMLDTGIRDG